MRKHIGMVIVGALCAFGAGCGDDSGTGGTGGSGGSGGSGGTGGGGAVSLCETPGTEVTLPSEIDGDTLLSADCTYLIDKLTYVVSGTLSIDPGTEIFGLSGAEPAALIVTQNGRIDASGTQSEPIVFTSGANEGERVSGQWGGVVLLGKARLSFGGSECDGNAGTCTDVIEGLDPGETRGQYGGDDDTHDCGTMRYVRIEFAGFELTTDNELNSLTLGGCGSDTTISYVQAHRGQDDAIEFFGGTANLDHFIGSGMDDDGLDWDQGFRGTVNYFIIDHFAGGSPDPRGMETDNNGADFDSEPRSNPEVNWGTLIGGPGTNDGIRNREGTWGRQTGLVVTGFGADGYNMYDNGWVTGWSDQLFVKDSCFFNNNPNYPVDDNDPDDATTPTAYFDEPDELSAAGLGNLEADPELPAATTAAPASRPSATGGTPDYTVGNANCIGAFGPEGTDWTTGWTAFPAD